MLETVVSFRAQFEDEGFAVEGCSLDSLLGSSRELPELLSERVIRNCLEPATRPTKFLVVDSLTQNARSGSGIAEVYDGSVSYREEWRLLRRARDGSWAVGQVTRSGWVGPTEEGVEDSPRSRISRHRDPGREGVELAPGLRGRATRDCLGGDLPGTKRRQATSGRLGGEAPWTAGPRGGGGGPPPCAPMLCGRGPALAGVRDSSRSRFSAGRVHGSASLRRCSRESPCVDRW